MVVNNVFRLFVLTLSGIVSLWALVHPGISMTSEVRDELVKKNASKILTSCATPRCTKIAIQLFLDPNTRVFKTIWRQGESTGPLFVLVNMQEGVAAERCVFAGGEEAKTYADTLVRFNGGPASAEDVRRTYLLAGEEFHPCNIELTIEPLDEGSSDRRIVLREESSVEGHTQSDRAVSPQSLCYLLDS